MAALTQVVVVGNDHLLCSTKHSCLQIGTLETKTGSLCCKDTETAAVSVSNVNFNSVSRK